MIHEYLIFSWIEEKAECNKKIQTRHLSKQV